MYLFTNLVYTYMYTHLRATFSYIVFGLSDSLRTKATDLKLFFATQTLGPFAIFLDLGPML
jgi:hypothetical protein